MLTKLIAPIATALVLAAATLIVAAPSHSSDAAAPLDAEEQLFLDLLNNYRVQNGRQPLAIDTKLQDAAEWMSVDMGVNGYFSHTDSLGRDPFVRMAAFGYDYNTWKGENLAAGTSSAQVAFDLWKGSSGHNANMLGSNYVAIGIARAYTAGSPYGWYWTTDFGGFLSSPMPPQSSPTPAPSPTPSPTPPPPGADTDGDGFSNGAETAIGSNSALPCGDPDTSKPGSPSRNWPADLAAGASANKVDIQDVISFISPVRRLNTSPGDPGFDGRWDLVPGKGPWSNVINVSDLAALTTLAPPMFGGQRAFGGPACQ